MSIPLPHYAKIKNRYCVCYFGSANEYIWQLLNLRPHIESQLPGIELYISYKDELSNLIKNQPKTITQSNLYVHKKLFAYIRVLQYDLKQSKHPVLEFMTESQLNIPKFVPIESNNRKCVISPQAVFPSKSLSSQQISHCKELFTKRGYVVEIGEDTQDAGWVVGPENLAVFQAGFKNIPTSLIPTGVGKDLYLSLFNGEILNL